MASLIKNQILKHLSKFTKNLSPDKLQLSAIKGSCEVNNIELNEDVLMQLLELPLWMSLTKAYCNFASIKIQWMKLKTVPIFIILDEVIVEIETCENFRDEVFNSRLDKQFNQEAGSYGFTQKVTDGISLSINSVVVQFTSKIFSASFELTRLNVESRNCKWKKVDDLSKTRIRDSARGQVLLFKHLEWQTLRFVAKSEASHSVGQAPLRLIANQGSCRITLKKRLSDSAGLGARIMIIFDDLLWVLTDSQLLSALHFADYLGDLIKRAPRTKKFEATEAKNNQIAKAKILNLNTSSPTKKPQTALSNSISLLFSQYDFLETSHHIIIRRIEVHLMDDLSPQSERSQCPDLREGGALQISLHRLLIDLYPYQSINGSRKHWFRYNEPSPNRQSFINHKLKNFYLRQQVKEEGPNLSLQSLYSHLLSRVLVIRLSDYSIGCVSTNQSGVNKRDQNDADMVRLIAFDNSAAIPGNVNPVYIELNNYFYMDPFDKLDLPLPETNVFVSVAPVKIHFDPLTILWINAFFANLHNALIKLQEAFPPDTNTQDKVNIRAEILMPTIVLSLGKDSQFSQKYSSLEVKISRVLLYNCDSFIGVDFFRNLEHLVKHFDENSAFFHQQSEYPWLSCDMKPISDEFMHKTNQLFGGSKSIQMQVSQSDIDFMVIQIEPLWMEFKSKVTNRNEPFVEPINLSLWINMNQPESPVDFNVFLKVLNPVNVQLTHDQFMFLLRIIEMFGDFTSTLNYDTYMIQRSHFKRDFEKKYLNEQLCAFDLEEKIVRAIFKNNSLIGSIDEVNLLLKLKEEETLEEVEKCALDMFEKEESPEKIGSDITLNSNEFDLNSTLSSSNSTSNGNDFVTVDGRQLGPQLVENSVNLVNNSLSPSPVIVSSVSDDNLKQYERVPLAASKKNNFINTSFDSSALKIHYCNNDNDDTLSTFSDLSADDSDQQSMIAMINDGSDYLDEIFAESETVEEALELFENYKVNEDEDTLNDAHDINVVPEKASQSARMITVSHIDALHAQIRHLDLIQQSSKGFLSQIFVNLSVASLTEHQRLTKDDYDNMFKKVGSGEECNVKSLNRVTVRLDSFNKGTLRDELVSVFVRNLKQELKKETIDLVVDFFNDNITEQVAPTAILLEEVQFKIIDNSVRVPPVVFTVPKLKLARNKQNKWIVELNTTLPLDAPSYNQLLLQHLKIFERNLLFDVKQLIQEQDRLNLFDTKLLNRNGSLDTQEILDQVLNQKELLMQEIELLRKENQELRKMIEK